MELFVTAILLTVAGAQQSRMERPQNTLDIVGSNVTLRCSTPFGNCIGVDWEKSIPQTNPETIFRDRPDVEGILNAYRDRYRVDNSSGCDLVITDVKLTDGGRFTCRFVISSIPFELSAFLFVLSAQLSPMEGPQNTLNIVRSKVTLKCSPPSGNCIGVDWQKSHFRKSPQTIFSDHIGILNTYRDRYSVDTSSGCDLLLNDVKLTDAGRFTCRFLISARTIEKSAYLIVLKNEPKCTNNASLNDTVEGDGVQLTCEVAYNGTGRVSLLWKDVENALAPAKSGETISQSYSVVASAPEVPSFTCVTSFEAEGVVDGSAWNTPTIACETQAIKVLYPVRNVTLSPSFSYYFPGTTITCSAKGHPSPGFKWQVRVSGNEETWMDIHNQNNSEFVVSNVTSRPYRCVAMNVVRGRNYSAHSSEFQVNRPGYLPPIVPIAFGVAVGFLVLIILFNICFCVRSCPGYRCCHSEKKSKYKIRFASRQRKFRRDIPRAGTTQPCQHGGQHESVYESLGDDIGTNTYESVA